MQSVEKSRTLTVEEYLESEPGSAVRREFLGGHVYPMPDSTMDHNSITGNLAAPIHTHLRGTACRVFAITLKLRLHLRGDEIFYYPDLMIACDPRDTDRYFKRHPSVLIEVLSESTERTDRREKFLSYTQIDTLEEYVLVAQDRMEVTVFRRADQWQPQVLHTPTQSLRLASIDFELPLAAIYEGIKLAVRG